MKKVLVSICGLVAIAFTLVACNGISQPTNPCAPYTYCLGVNSATYQTSNGEITGDITINTSPAIPNGSPVALLFGTGPGTFVPSFGAAGVSNGSANVAMVIAGTYNGCLPNPTYLSLLVNNVQNTVGTAQITWSGTTSCPEDEERKFHMIKAK